MRNPELCLATLTGAAEFRSLDAEQWILQPLGAFARTWQKHCGGLRRVMQAISFPTCWNSYTVTIHPSDAPLQLSHLGGEICGGKKMASIRKKRPGV